MDAPKDDPVQIFIRSQADYACSMENPPGRQGSAFTGPCHRRGSLSGRTIHFIRSRSHPTGPAGPRRERTKRENKPRQIAITAKTANPSAEAASTQFATVKMSICRLLRRIRSSIRPFAVRDCSVTAARLLALA